MTKFRMKKLALALALSGACAAANATMTDLGTLPIGATPFFGAILHEQGSTDPVTFGDIFLFELPANGGSSYAVINFPLPQLGFGTAFTSLALWSAGPDKAVGGADDTLEKLVSGVGTSSTSLSLSFGPTSAPQTMFLVVNGLTTDAAGGLYSGAISVSPVPEAEVWAMMLIGVGLVGFRLRHCSKRSSAARFA